MPMNAALYKNLTKCDAKEGWYLVKDVVCAQLMDTGVVGVPFLEEGASYNAGYVVLKEARSPMEKLGRRTPAAIPVGVISDFTDKASQPSDYAFADEIVNSLVEESGTFNQQYIFREFDMKNGLKKEITVTVEGCSKGSLRLFPEQRDLNLAFAKRGYLHLKKFYFIPTVFYATKVKVTVTFNNETDEMVVEKKIPVGFKLWKFGLDEHGHVLPNRKPVDPDNWKVQWIHKKYFRNPMDRLPDAPQKLPECQDHADEDAEGYITLPGASGRQN